MHSSRQEITINEESARHKEGLQNSHLKVINKSQLQIGFSKEKNNKLLKKLSLYLKTHAYSEGKATAHRSSRACCITSQQLMLSNPVCAVGAAQIIILSHIFWALFHWFVSYCLV